MWTPAARTPTSTSLSAISGCGRNQREAQDLGGAVRILHDCPHRFSRCRPVRIASHRREPGLRCHELFLSIRWAVLPAVLCTRGYHTKYGSAIAWKGKGETNQ